MSVTTASGAVRFEIAKKPTPPDSGLEKKKWWIYGPSGVGKSTYANTFPDPLFCDTQDGLKEMTARKNEVSSWSEFDRFIETIEEDFRAGKRPCETLVIDMIDDLWNNLENEVAMAEDPSYITAADIPYGKGVPRVRVWFKKMVQRITLLPCRVVFISHSTETKPNKKQESRIIPALHEEGRKALLGLMDYVFYCSPDTVIDDHGNEHTVPTLRTDCTPEREAKSRTPGLPHVIKMDGGYRRFELIHAKVQKAKEEQATGNKKQQTKKEEGATEQ